MYSHHPARHKGLSVKRSDPKYFLSGGCYDNQGTRHAAERIANKWTGSGDISCEARGCAVDLIAHYARTQGIELIERGDEPAEKMTEQP